LLAAKAGYGSKRSLSGDSAHELRLAVASAAYFVRSKIAGYCGSAARRGLSL